MIKERLESIKANGESSLASIMYKLILIDFSIPDMDGPTTVIEIRKLIR